MKMATEVEAFGKNDDSQFKMQIVPWWVSDERMGDTKSTPIELEKINCCTMPMLFWMEHYRNMAEDVQWLKKKAALVETGISAEVDYAFLYVLLRILDEYHPKNILEFNFGQATKIVAQYAAENLANHTVLEHDCRRVEHFIHCWSLNGSGTTIHGSELIVIRSPWGNGWGFSNFQQNVENQKYNMILLKCPFVKGLENKPHVDIMMKLPDLLDDDFAILMDHIEDEECNKIFTSIRKVLVVKGISYIGKEFSSLGRRVGLLVSENWKYVEEY